MPFVLCEPDSWPVRYRTLNSYNLNWAVCHLFPQQRWRMNTNIQSRETIGQENHVTCLKLRHRLNFVPRFLEPIPKHVFSINTSSSNTLSLFPNFYCSAPVWLSYSPTNVKIHKMDQPNLLFLKILCLWDFFQPRKHQLFQTTARNEHLKICSWHE